tara:strand:- start:43 stop:180 length:138 start_codon:yes stop_codon:yes gene_type:complete
MIKIIALALILPVIAFYTGFTLGGLVFAIYKEIRAINEERRNTKK